jgi:hypothetical protein
MNLLSRSSHPAIKISAISNLRYFLVGSLFFFIRGSNLVNLIVYDLSIDYSVPCISISLLDQRIAIEIQKKFDSFLKIEIDLMYNM